MSQLRPMLCPQCGAPLRNEGECDYCGVRFFEDDGEYYGYTEVVVNTTGPALAYIEPGFRGSIETYSNSITTSNLGDVLNDVVISYYNDDGDVVFSGGLDSGAIASTDIEHGQFSLDGSFIENIMSKRKSRITAKTLFYDIKALYASGDIVTVTNGVVQCS